MTLALVFLGIAMGFGVGYYRAADKISKKIANDKDVRNALLKIITEINEREEK